MLHGFLSEKLPPSEAGSGPKFRTIDRVPEFSFCQFVFNGEVIIPIASICGARATWQALSTRWWLPPHTLPQQYVTPCHLTRHPPAVSAPRAACLTTAPHAPSGDGLCEQSQPRSAPGPPCTGGSATMATPGASGDLHCHFGLQLSRKWSVAQTSVQPEEIYFD